MRKDLFFKLSVKMSVMTFLILLFSCQTEENVRSSVEREFVRSIKPGIDKMLDVKISQCSSTRGNTIELDTSKIVIVSKWQLTDEEQYKISSAQTLRELVVLGRQLDLMFKNGNSLNNGDNNELTKEYYTTVGVSESDIKQSMKQAVQKSKEFLIDRGMSNDDIIAMLEETNADETTLVPLVLAMAEYEDDAASSYTAYTNKDLGMMSIFATPAYAEVPWQKVGKCALTAIGIDITGFAFTSRAVKWTKAIILRVFKSIALKAIGPVGAAVAFVSFALCMGDML